MFRQQISLVSVEAAVRFYPVLVSLPPAVVDDYVGVAFAGAAEPGRGHGNVTLATINADGIVLIELHAGGELSQDVSIEPQRGDGVLVDLGNIAQVPHRMQLLG